MIFATPGNHPETMISQEPASRQPLNHSASDKR
jgi:hypothetical protein